MGLALLLTSGSEERTKYACLTSTFHFVPIAVETLGSFGDEADNFIHDLGRRITTVTGERRATEFLLQPAETERCNPARQRSQCAGTVYCQSSNLDAVYCL